MDNRKFSLGSGEELKFFLTEEPHTHIPMWAAEIDELWLNITGGYLYEYLTRNIPKLVTSNLINPKDYAASMAVADFKSAIMTGALASFQNIIFNLKDFLDDHASSIPRADQFVTLPAPVLYVPQMYVSLFSTSSDHYLNAMIDSDALLIGASLGDAHKDL